MGTLSIPTFSVVYVDTQIVIYSAEKFPEYFSILQSTNDRDFRAIASLPVILSEVLAS